MDGGSVDPFEIAEETSYYGDTFLSGMVIAEKTG
jgi:hypothetical protein